MKPGWMVIVDNQLLVFEIAGECGAEEGVVCTQLDMDTLKVID